MKFSTKYLIIALSLCCQSLLFAHNPQQSTIRLTFQENSGLLSISLAQYGIEQALIKKYPDLDLKTIEPKDFKVLLIDYIKKSVLISINGQQFKIGSGAIKLGSHNTELKFIIKNVPEKINYIDVEATCFKENEKQLNFFKVAYNHLGARAKLSSENNFKAKFTVTDDKVSVSEGVYISKEGNNTIIWIGGICLFIVVLLLIKKLKQRKI